MEVHFCDLCGCPIHGKRYILAVLVDEVVDNLRSADKAYMYNPSDSCILKREVCPVCSEIIEQLFENRKEGLNRLTKGIKNIYSLDKENRGIKK